MLIASLLELKSRLLLPAPRRRRSSSARRRRPTSCSRGCSSTAATATRPRTSPSSSPRARLPLPLGAAAPGAAARRARRRPAELRGRAAWRSRSATSCACRRRPTPATSGPTVSLERRLRCCASCCRSPRAIDFDESLRRRGQAHPGRDALRAAGAPQARRGDLGAGRGRSGPSRSGGPDEVSSNKSSKRCCSSRRSR